MKTYLKILLLILNINALVAQVEYQRHLVFDESYGTLFPRAVFAADLDGDGDLDILSASSDDNKIAWYENNNGIFERQSQISLQAQAARSIYAVDIDGDGDIDVLSASAWDNKIAWYENTDGIGTFSEQKIITIEAYWANSVYAVDIDGDGDIDVLSASAWDNKIAWYENLDGDGTFSAPKIIFDQAIGARSVFAADIDNDGDMDVLSASRDDNKARWYENLDGFGSEWDIHTVSSTAEGINSIYAADMDGDGDMDVLSASMSDSKIVWYPNENGSFNNQDILCDDCYGATSVFPTDIDNDGDLDVLYSSSYNEKIAWFENINGIGEFGTKNIIQSDLTGAYSAFAGDLDNDGDMDVLYASQRRNLVAWHENISGIGDFGGINPLGIMAENVSCLVAEDIDNDGNLDIISSSYYDNKVAWYKNTGEGSFDFQNIITMNAMKAISIATCDIDNDGDQDIISASYEDSKIAWYRNNDGQGQFNDPVLITIDTIEMIRNVKTGDIDSDGDMDVLIIASEDIYWAQNLNGLGDFSSLQSLSSEIVGYSNAYLVDLDEDGDLDILSSSSMTGFVVWFENIDGQGNFSLLQVIGTFELYEPRKLFPFDMDGDGDLDILVCGGSYEGSNKIFCIKNKSENNFSNPILIKDNLPYINSLSVSDFDEDGDFDIFASFPLQNKVVWFENLDGITTFSESKVLTSNVEKAKAIINADIDNDGDSDLLFAYSLGKIAWIENPIIDLGKKNK